MWQSYTEVCWMKTHIPHCNEKDCYLVMLLNYRTIDYDPLKGRPQCHRWFRMAWGQSTGLLTSASWPLLPCAPRPISKALYQPLALQVVTGAAAQHHLGSVLVQGAWHQPPGHMFWELGFDARASDRWKETHLASSLCSKESSWPTLLERACCMQFISLVEWMPLPVISGFLYDSRPTWLPGSDTACKTHSTTSLQVGWKPRSEVTRKSLPQSYEVHFELKMVIR